MAAEEELGARSFAGPGNERLPWAIVGLTPNADQLIENPPLELDRSGAPKPRPEETSRGFYKCDVALSVRPEAERVGKAQAAPENVTIASGYARVLLTDSRLCGVIQSGHHLARRITADDDEALVFAFELCDLTDITADVARGFFKPPTATSVSAYAIAPDRVVTQIKCVVCEDAPYTRAVIRRTNSGRLLTNLVQAAAAGGSPLKSFQANGALRDPGVHIPLAPLSQASDLRQGLLSHLAQRFHLIA